jgi:hypothetical protein
MTQRIFLAGVVLATLASTGKPQTPQGSEQSIRTLIGTFADARNSQFNERSSLSISQVPT